MEPFYKQFYNDEEVVSAVDTLQGKGIKEDDMYVLTHDPDRTNRVADNADANTVGTTEAGLETRIKNVFRKRGDELRAQFQELGFSQSKSEELEEELDKGKVILVVKDAQPGLTL